MLAFAFVRLTTSHFSVAFKLHKYFMQTQACCFTPTVTTYESVGIQCELLTPPAAPYVHEEQLDEVEHDGDYMDVDYDPSADFDEEEDEDDRIDESDDEYVL